MPTNTTANLQGVDRDLGIATAGQTLSGAQTTGYMQHVSTTRTAALSDLQKVVEDLAAYQEALDNAPGLIPPPAPVVAVAPLTPAQKAAEYSPYYVTRAEFNLLMDRITSFNKRSGQTI
jgi:hypothetical protein